MFADNGTPYASLHATLTGEDLAQAIHSHAEVQQLIGRFTDAFADFPAQLRHRLIDHAETVPIAQQESEMSAAIFQRLASMPLIAALIDKYHAYQLLTEQWQQIAVDLEVIQTEGFAATRGVDPQLVIKKKDGKDIEVQDGWQGRILPFELVQTTLLNAERNVLREQENRLTETTSAIDELLDGLSEEEKSSDAVNEAGDKFVPTVVVKEAKDYKAEQKKSGAFAADSFEAKIMQAADLLAQEKALKATVKQQAAELHLLTKTTIEGLTDEQVRVLLEQKWITPLQDALQRLPAQQMDTLSDKLHALVEKYRITYADNARAIQHSERELAAMLDELDGNAFDLKGLHELKTLLTGNDHAQG